MTTVGFPTNWSVLKTDGQSQPYYYAMGYTDDLLGYQFFITDFHNVWTQSAYFHDIIEIARKRNMILTEEAHVREVVGVLNGCLFQQFYDNEVYQRQYRCDFHLHKSNPYQDVNHQLYLNIAVKNGFKWDFNVNIVPPLAAAKVLKMLKFSLFNIVFRMDMQSSSLVEVIKEKDRAIQFLLEVVDQLHGNGQVMKFKGSSETSHNAKILQKFNYNYWVKNWKISKIKNELKQEHNDIWSVIDKVSRNPDLWEFSANYYDSQDPRFCPPADLQHQTYSDEQEGQQQHQSQLENLFNDEQPNHTTDFVTRSSIEDGSISEEKFYNYNNDEEKTKLEQYATDVDDDEYAEHLGSVSPSSPSKRKAKKRANSSLHPFVNDISHGPATDANWHRDDNLVENLSQSFTDYVDIKKDGDDQRIMKIPMSPSLKRQQIIEGHSNLDKDKIPNLTINPSSESNGKQQNYNFANLERDANNGENLDDFTDIDSDAEATTTENKNENENGNDPLDMNGEGDDVKYNNTKHLANDEGNASRDVYQYQHTNSSMKEFLEARQSQHEFHSHFHSHSHAHLEPRPTLSASTSAATSQRSVLPQQQKQQQQQQQQQPHRKSPRKILATGDSISRKRKFNKKSKKPIKAPRLD